MEKTVEEIQEKLQEIYADTDSGLDHYFYKLATHVHNMIREARIEEHRYCRICNDYYDDNKKCKRIDELQAQKGD